MFFLFVNVFILVLIVVVVDLIYILVMVLIVMYCGCDKYDVIVESLCVNWGLVMLISVIIVIGFVSFNFVEVLLF